MSVEADLQPAPDEHAPGLLLGRLRAARELSISDVAERLKYSPRQIEALEADDYGKLPGATFVRGMIRGYAKLLQTDPVPVIREFEGRHAPERVNLTLQPELIPFPDATGRVTRLYLALAALAVVSAAAVLYEWQFAGSPSAPAVVQPVPPAPVALQPPSVAEPAAQEPSPEAVPQERSAPASVAAPTAAAPTAALSETKRILLEFQKDSWVEIKDRGGQTLLSQLNPGGSRATVQGMPPFSLIIGNAAGVRLTYNDAMVDLKPYVKVEVARLTLD